jgi:hypothetical protein
MSYKIIPANPGFRCRYTESSDWCDVIAWRIAEDGSGACPITLWCVVGAHYESYLLETPSGEVERMSE